jgi:hypothetical protein
MLGPEFFEALVHDLLAGVTVWPPLFIAKEVAIDFPTGSARDVPGSIGPLIQDEGTRLAPRPRLGRALPLRSFPGGLLDEERSQGFLDEGLLGRELPAFHPADQKPLKVVREDDMGKVHLGHQSAPLDRALTGKAERRSGPGLRAISRIEYSPSVLL